MNRTQRFYAIGLFLGGAIATVTGTSAGQYATQSTPPRQEFIRDTIRPGTYVFCRPYSASALNKSMVALRDPAFKTFDAVNTEAGVLRTLRQSGGALVRFRNWREVALRYDDNMWSMRNSVPSFIYRDDGYLYRNRTLDAIAVTDELVPAYNNSFYPRLAFIHVRALNGMQQRIDGTGPRWIGVSTLVTTPICKR